MNIIVFTIIVALLSLIVEGLLGNIQSYVVSISDYAFDIETYIDGALNSELTSDLLMIFAVTALSLITVLFLKKGFETYIVYSDGDPDSDPIQLLTLYCKGIAIITCGSYVIEIFIAVVKGLTNKIQDLFTGILSLDNITEDAWATFLNGLFPEDPAQLGLHLLGIIFVIVYGVLAVALFFSTLKDGLELWLIKIGTPLAAVGLINADKGIFKNYAMSIAKALVTIMIKVCLFNLGFILVVGCQEITVVGTDMTMFGMVLGIMCNIMAFTTPKLLQEFMIAGGGGMGMMKIYYAKNLISSLRRGK